MEGEACNVEGRGHVVERKYFCLQQVYDRKERLLLLEEIIQPRESIIAYNKYMFEMNDFYC